MSFMPNMSPEEVAELDKERGKKFYDEEDHNETKDLPVKKEPWLNKTPVNKSGESNMSGTNILKSYLSKASLNADDDDGCEDLLKMNDKDEMEEEEVEKALNSRSMYIPRPQGQYDRFDIMRSATTPNTRQHSALTGPDGIAPLVGDTLRTVEDDANVRSKQTTYKHTDSLIGLTESALCATASLNLTPARAAEL